ncbi:MAG: TetR/AcrR family transcriptional regulator [Microbacteriaceae bacterium]|jgi:AcrR family transcriptional regulator|nr:TetR/AcrR family transcriptional regulator [Microbacteriaceae bacterium]
MSTTTSPVKRPGGRSAAVMSSIKTAVEELIAERGRDRVTIPMIAERAGVNPTSVYRRWGDLPTMINDIATYRLDPARPIPEGPDLKANLTEWAREIVTHYSSPVNAELLRGGASSAGVTESDCTRNRRAEATVMVERAGSSATVTVDEVINYLVAPIIYRIIFLPWTLTETTADELVTRLFA